MIRCLNYYKLDDKQLLLREQQHEADQRNQKLNNPDLPLLIGEVNDDVVNEVNEHSYIETHEKVLPLMHIFQSTLYKYFELIFMKRKSSY